MAMARTLEEQRKARAAQRRLAKQVHEGTYKQSRVGKASAKARAKLTVKTGRKTHNQRIFHKLDKALDFVANYLNPDQTFYIIGRGTYADPSKYEAEKGDASLISGHTAGTSRFADKHIRERDEELFTETTSYWVRWWNGH
jgi:hypothetical protein